MHKTALTTIAPEIFRKRLLIEGYFRKDITRESLVGYFAHVTGALNLRMYGEPIIHQTSGQGKETNDGFDGFVPLVDSGIYIGVWVNPRFLSTIIYTCGPFDENLAVTLVADFFQLGAYQAAIF